MKANRAFYEEDDLETNDTIYWYKNFDILKRLTDFKDNTKCRKS
jgi:hypothetical protein